MPFSKLPAVCELVAAGRRQMEAKAEGDTGRRHTRQGRRLCVSWRQEAD